MNPSGLITPRNGNLLLIQKQHSEAAESLNRGVEFVEVKIDSDGQRLDNFIMSRLKGVPKSRIYRLVRKGEVRINKKRAKPESRVHTGDIVRLPPLRMAAALPPLRPSENLVHLLRSNILFENNDLLVINKPQGIAVHGGSGLKIGVIEAMRWIKSEAEEGSEFLELVHRIDKDTTGCLVIAKNAIILKALQNEFKARNVSKVYHALVHGRWPDEIIHVNAPLLKREVKAGEKVVTVDDEGKASETDIKVLQRFRNATLIEASPLTGRTHQIRVHCQYAGHPIIGDSKYTSATASAFPEVRNLCLHAAAISFTVLDTDARFSFSAPMNPVMLNVMEQLQAQ